MKKLIMAGLIAAAIGSTSTTFAASGSTSITINFPEVIILHYFSSITLNFNAIDVADDEGAATLTGNLTDNTVLDAAINPTGAGSLSDAINIWLQNVWAVRAITNSGTVTLSSNLDSATATSASGLSTAAASNLILEDVTGTYTGASIQFPAPGLNLANTVMGGVKFDLDLKMVTESGAHTGIQYTLTAVTP